MKTRLVTLLLIVSSVFSGWGQNLRQYAGNIEEKRLREHVRYLASNELEGRNTGSEGQKRAASYIRDQYLSSLLQGPVNGKDPYYQHFELFSRKRIVQRLETATDTLDSSWEYMIDNGKTEFEGSRSLSLVFVGYGMERDFSAVNVKGKVAIYFDGFPAADSIKPRNYLNLDDEKSDRARAHGALGAIKIFDDTEFSRSFIKTISAYADERMRGDIPFSGGIDSVLPNPLGVLPSGAARLLGLSLPALEEERKTLDNGQPVAHPYTRTIRLSSHYQNDIIKTQNVLGVIRGEKYPDEWIVVMAHYDHLGIRAGKVYPGANDNASGVAALLEVARTISRMKQDGHSPDRSILFIAVTGEEKGLLGSSWYTDHPVVPIENTRMIVNIDMLGRSDIRHSPDERYVYIDLKDTLQSPVSQICSSVQPALEIDSLAIICSHNGKTRAMGSSDHMSFSKHDIPFVYYYNGTHSDWHQPTDTWEKINYGLLESITRHLFGMVWKLAEMQ